MLTIFLDIDGVLNKESDWKEPYTINKECSSAFLSFLKDIRENCSIVLISTWRFGMKDVKYKEDADYIRELRAIFFDCDVEIKDRTPASNQGRQKEILYYLNRHPFIDRYLTIDDDTSLYEDGSKVHLYIPDYRTGFTKKDTSFLLSKKGRKLWA